MRIWGGGSALIRESKPPFAEALVREFQKAAAEELDSSPAFLIALKKEEWRDSWRRE